MTVTAWDRIVRLEGVNNFRDYGGWRAADGARVATGKLFRSAHLGRATPSDLAQMAALGIATVTDLRRTSEQEEQPSAWIGKLDLAVLEERDPPGDAPVPGTLAPHQIALVAGNFQAEAMRRMMVSVYRELAYDPRHMALFRRYFTVLADGEGAMLIHCAAGKDRTGVLAHLTHHLLGVHPDDAMEDFLLTNVAGNTAERLPAVQRRMEQTYGRDIGLPALEVMLSVEPEYIAEFRKALTERSGSLDGYLADVLGIDAAKRDRIRGRLLA